MAAKPNVVEEKLNSELIAAIKMSDQALAQRIATEVDPAVRDALKEVQQERIQWQFFNDDDSNLIQPGQPEVHLDLVALKNIFNSLQ